VARYPPNGHGSMGLHDPCPDFVAVRIAISSLLSLKPLQDLSNGLPGAIDARAVSRLTQGRDVA